METRAPSAPLPHRGALHLLLAATAALPLFAVLPGMREGEVAFVLYWEPKLAAVQILGWGLLAALFWCRSADLQPAALAAALLRPPWRWLGLFLAWGLVTASWAAVPGNAFYELSQYLPLLLLVLGLQLWARSDPAVPEIVETGLVLSVGAAALVGWIQAEIPLAFLAPIDPGSGVANPSFLGYKNPMALVLAGQMFLLVGLIWKRWAGRSGPWLAGLLAAELIYLASLRSRTAYAALVGAAVLLVVLLLARERFRAPALRLGLAAALGTFLFLAAVAADPGTRERASTVVGYLTRPATYLESDRGIYLVNSFHMVRHHPLGVGLGDWQTQYPLYRRVHRDRWFTPSVQVRKAHNDHVQALAETGWPGLCLWLAFWLSLLALPVRAFLQGGDPRLLLLAAQVAVFVLAMATDSLAEHPYLKLQMLLVAFLAAGPAPAAAAPRGERAWPAVLVTVLAAAAVLGSGAVVRKAWLGASLTESYLAAMDHQRRRGGDPYPDAVETALLERAARAGAAFARTPGHGKDLCDDYRLLAAAEASLGRREQALAYARTSLRLHPYSPNALRLMAELSRDRPFAAARWDRAAEYVMNEATAGFAEPYPDAKD